MFGTGRSVEYKRDKVVQYAHKWAFGRNLAYLNFDGIGGDCTNFASQAIFAGSEKMNYDPTNGWYYTSSYNRTPSWTGVNYLHDFLVKNVGVGPFAENTDVNNILKGDLIQLSFNGEGIFQHSCIVVQTGSPADISNILVATHTDDTDYYRLTNYNWTEIRFIHILGVRF